MPDVFRSWFKENQTLVVFLAAQMFTFGAAGISIVAYYVKMETRVTIMETRGAEYTVSRLNVISERITILEQKIDKNSDSINRIVNVMTRELKLNEGSKQ